MVAGHHVPPASVVLVLLGQRLDGAARAVLDQQLRREPDQTTGVADAEVQLPVLGADELLVVAALLFQRLTAEDAEIDGLGRSRLAAGVERSVADTDLRGHRRGHGLFPGVLALGVHDAADVLGAGLLQEADGGGDVVRRQHAVAVDAHHDRVAGGLDGGVEGRRGPAGGIRDGVDSGILGDEFGGDLVGAVRGRPECDHHLHLARVLLFQDVADGIAEVVLLVEHRHDHRDCGLLGGHVVLQGRVSVSRYRVRGNRVRAERSVRTAADRMGLLFCRIS